VFPLAIIAILAAVRVPYPFHGDQTVFMLGAQALERGGTLYVDFWDAKQPGVFVFYWMAGKLFGFSPVGVHLFELIWNLALAAWMIRLLRAHLAFPALASIAPVAAIGGYYAVAGTWELTQVEMLASLPLFACVAAAWPGYRSPRSMRLGWLASGIAAGIAVLFKLLFAPVAVATWLVAAGIALRVGGARWTDVLRDRWAPAALGVIIVLGTTVAVFAAAGALEPMLWTAFVYPMQALSLGTHMDPVRLASTAKWFLLAFAPLVLFALAVRAQWRGDGLERVFLLAMIWWVAGLAVILIQTLSWWRYHFLLLLVPVAILAVRGIDGIAGSARARLRWSPAVAAVTGLLLGALACVPAWRVWMNDSPVTLPPLRTAEELVAFQRSVSPEWDRIWNDTAFLREPGARPGPIYVFGDPRAITLAGRDQAIAINGWSWESYAQRLWDELPSQLREAKPVYLGIEPVYERLLRDRAPEVWAWIEANYRIARSDERRVWFERVTTGDS
jgi:hypothetical protein